MQPLEIAQALIAKPSITPHDAGALGVLDAILGKAGFATHRVTFSAPGTPDIENLYARLGTGAPHLLFAGHTDVVPPGDAGAWTHGPFDATVSDGMLYGRGAQDMKGGIACFVAAALAYVADHGEPAGSIGLLITGDEEGPAVNGTVKLLEWAHERGERFDHCIVGEPTSREQLGDMIKIGRRGSLNGRVVAHGRQGHVAYPARANNPIPALLRVLQALLEPLDGGTSRFDASNLEITTVDVGNPATNVIPAQATAAFNIRFNDTWTNATLVSELRARAAAAAAGADVTLEFMPFNAPAFVTPLSPFTDLVVAAVEAAVGRKPVLSTTGGTSDARFIQAYCPVIELGLVGDTMHMVDERVPVADLDGLAAIYRGILERYFAR